jgi:hypothetical protein
MQKAMIRRSIVYVMKAPAMLFVAIFLFAQAAHTADIQKGIAAYKDRDYAAALEEFQPLAQQGDVQAEFYLGLMYDRGYGVTQDDDQAFLVSPCLGSGQPHGAIQLRYEVRVRKWRIARLCRGGEMTKDQIADGRALMVKMQSAV